MPAVAPRRARWLTRAARRDLYQDDVNEGAVHAPRHPPDPRRWSSSTARGVDGAVGGLAALVGGLLRTAAPLQNGYARSYALTMLAGVVVILGAVWVMQ